MKIKNYSQIIHKWILSLLLNNKKESYSLLDDNFKIENGMNKDEYYIYEHTNFTELSPIFDLNQEFTVEILNIIELQHCDICQVYVINNSGKIVCKMDISINSDEKITSNLYISQVIPKYQIENNQITKLGLAIKCQQEPKYIISNILETENIKQGSNFEKDTFYYASFIPKDKNFLNKSVLFKIIYESGLIEKRYIFFNNYDNKLCPIEITKETIKTIDSKYPVALSIFYNNNSQTVKEYPRNFETPNINISKIIATDSIDNDWVFYND